MARTSTIELPRLIASAARRLLDRDGPSAVTYRAVAGEAGVSVGSIRNRFGTAAGLLDYVALRGFGELRDRILGVGGRELHTIGAPGATLDVAVDRYRAWAMDNPHLHRLMFDGPANGVTPSPFTRRAADECLILFDAAARSPVEGRRRFVEELGRVQLAASGLVVGSAGAEHDPAVTAPAPPHRHRP